MEIQMTFSKKNSTMQSLIIICKIGLSPSLRTSKTYNLFPRALQHSSLGKTLSVCNFNNTDAQKDRCLFMIRITVLLCCLPTPMTLASGGGSPMFPLVVHQPASPSIWPTVQSLRRGLSTNTGVTTGAYVGVVEEMMCVVCVDVTEGA